MSNPSTTRGSLTPRQNEIYEYIRNCIQQQNAPPTITEIGARFGIRSTNGVNDLLNTLERKGYIIRIKGIARGIALPQNAPAGAPAAKGVKRIPIVGEGESSNPFSIFMNPHGMLTPDPVLFPTSNAFAAIVADDGMDKEGIFKGDYVLVHQSTTLPDGALVFALVGTQQVVRRLQRAGERRQLVSVNRYYGKIQVIEGSDDVALLGEVVGVMRVLRNSGESVVGGQQSVEESERLKVGSQRL
jgi:repressor LexA